MLSLAGGRGGWGVALEVGQLLVDWLARGLNLWRKDYLFSYQVDERRNIGAAAANTASSSFALFRELCGSGSRAHTRLHSGSNINH